MRCSRLLLYGAVALQASVVTSSHLNRRADGSSTSASAHPSSGPVSSPSNISSLASTSSISGSQSSSTVGTSNSASTVLSTSASPTESPTSTGIISLPTSSSNGTSETVDHSAPPLHPVITPAIGIAGALLMMTGCVYGLVGIRNKLIYHFFAVAYLASLAVTVMVLFLMNPPVSNAVQGAYLVAAIVVGLLLGGAAAVFNDITDIFVGALGGFCVSMWFLTLADGGSIKLKLGKVAFILPFMIVAGALSFHRFTREYALLGNIPFAGATAIVLGIDCFSRAGYKEFWIYIWDLNGNEFPLGTTTYPINRGMRVETAGIVLLFLLGLATQSKLYETVKRHRERQDAEAAREVRERDMQESAAGRRVMDQLSRDRAAWDAIYEGKKVDSAADGLTSSGSTTKVSGSVSERPLSREEVELWDMSGARELTGSATDVMRKGSRITVSEVGNARISQAAVAHVSIPRSETASRRSSALEAPPASDSKGISPRTSIQGNTLGVPPVVPLPFAVPTDPNDEPAKADSNAGSKVSTLSRKISSNRRSASSALKRISVKSSQDAGTWEEEPLTPNAEEDDRASSIAATLDLLDVDALSPGALSEPSSPLDQSFGPHQMQRPTGLSESPLPDGDQSLPSMNVEQNRQTSRDSNRLSANPSRRSIIETLRLSMISDGDEERLKLDEPHEESPKRSDSAERPALASLKVTVPELPKNLMIYRTNEWAKHAADADAPPLEELEPPASPGIQVLHEKPEDMPPKNTYGDAVSDMHAMSNSAVPEPPSAVYVPMGSAPMSEKPAVSRNSSTTNVSSYAGILPQSQSRVSRNAPMEGTNVGSQSTPAGHRRHDTDILTPLPHGTLLDKRNTKLRQRSSTSSGTSTNVPAYAFSSTPDLNRPMSPLTPDDSASVRNASFGSARVEPDNVSLAERKATMSRQSSGSSTSQFSGFSGLGTGAYQSFQAVQQQPFGFNTLTNLPLQHQHRPRTERTPSSFNARKRDQNESRWRESLNQERVKVQPLADEGRRLVLLSAKRQGEAMRLNAEMERRQFDDAFDRTMRSGVMVGRHNELIRKMQASVPKDA